MISTPPSPQAFEATQPTQTQSLDSQKTLGALHFQTLIQKIKDRNAQLGEIFEKNVKFVEFSREKSLLRWQSVAQGEHKEKLREFGKIIVSLVREIFGANTHIEQVQDNIQDSNSQATQDSQTQVEVPQDSQSPQNLQNPQAQQSPQNQQEGLQKFTSQNRDVIEAIRDSVGIKEVLVQNDKQDKGDENA